MRTGDEPALSRDIPSADEPQLGGEAAVIHLLQALESDDKKVRDRAMNTLAERGDARVVNALLNTFTATRGSSLLRRIENSNVDKHLVKLGQPSIAPLVTLMESTNHAADDAARVLGLIAAEHPTLRDEICPHLVRALQVHQHRSAAMALAQCGGAIPILAEALTASPERPLTFKIVEALSIAGTEGFTIVQPFVRGSAPDLRRELVVLYSKFKFDGVPAELIYFVQNDPDEHVRAKALEILMDYHEKHHAPDADVLTEIALKALDDPSFRVHVPAIYWLGQQRDRAYLPLLLNAAQSQYPVLREAGVVGLGLGQFEEGIPIIRAAFSDDYPPMFETAIVAAGNIGHASLLPDLLEILRGNRSAYFYHRLIPAIGKIGDPSAVPDLAAILAEYTGTPGVMVAQMAIEALAHIDDASAVDVLLSWFNTPHLRVYVVRPLAKTRSEEAIRALLDWAYAPMDVDDFDISLIGALTLIGDQRAVDALVHLGQSDFAASIRLGDQIRGALHRIGTPEALAAANLLTKRRTGSPSGVEIS